MTPWGVVNRKVFGPQGPSLTNRMSELLTYGSVGGVGRKSPAPTRQTNRRPATPLDAERQFASAICAPPSLSAAVAHPFCSAAV